MDAGMPWWVLAAIVWVLVSVASRPGSQEFSPFDGSAGVQASSTGQSPSLRRLQAGGSGPGGAAAPTPVSSDTVQPPPFALVPPKDGHKTPSLTLNVPCYLLVRPCGNVTIPSEGLTVYYPFHLGKYHIPGTKTLTPAIGKLELAFAHYTTIIVAVLFVAMVIYKCSQKLIRAKMARKWENLKEGVLDSDSDDDRTADDPEKVKEYQQERKARMDLNSKHFIAPGNIYRLLAVLHPAKIGWGLWLELAFRACVCAYMQLYLPYKIIVNILKSWHITGIKSPIWFIENSFAFATMFASLGSLCHVFQGRCAKHIKDGAEANHFILTHVPDTTQPSQETYETETGTPRVLRKGYRSLGHKIHKPELSPGQVRLNELFWCWLSMILNIAMSVMLQLCMFLKVATFTGAVEGVAVVAVSLYLIFDLDAKVLEDDSKLTIKYRRAIVKLTTEYPPDDPKMKEAHCLIRVAGAWMWLSHMVLPLMLVALVLFAWHNPELHILIGGSGLEGTTWAES